MCTVQLGAHVALPKSLPGSMSSLLWGTPAATASQKSPLSAKTAHGCWCWWALAGALLSPRPQTPGPCVQTPSFLHSKGSRLANPPQLAQTLSPRVSVAALLQAGIVPVGSSSGRAGQLPRVLLFSIHRAALSRDFAALHSHSSSFAGEGLLLLINHALYPASSLHGQ